MRISGSVVVFDSCPQSQGSGAGGAARTRTSPPDQGRIHRDFPPIQPSGRGVGSEVYAGPSGFLRFRTGTAAVPGVPMLLCRK